MIIDDTDQIKAEIEEAAAQRSESDQRNYTLATLIHHQSGIVKFQNCESFTAPPFDRCRTDEDKRRMLASIMAMAAACHLESLSSPAIAENYGMISLIYKEMREFEDDYLYSDKYLSSVSLPLGEKDGFLFGIEDTSEGQLFYYDAPAENGYYDIPRIGYFHQKARYPVVSKNGKLIAALNPNYFETMKRHVSVASGDVLCLGLKLGYFPYLTSLKDSVRTITVVEEDTDLVTLFESQILPQFPHAEKIIVLNDNPVSFLEKQHQIEYRHVFVCCGYDAMSSVSMYLKLKSFEKKYKKSKFTYWIEESILANIKSALLVSLVAENEKDPKDMYKTLFDNDEGEQIMEELRPFTDSLHIRSAKDVRSLFSNKALAKKIAHAEI